MTPRPSLVGPFPDGVDPEEYDRLRRRVMWMLPTGLYLLGSRDGERRNLMTCNWVSQLATEPKLIGVAVERAALSAELLRAGKVMSLSVLARDDRAVVRKFVRPAEHDPAAKTLNGVAYRDASVSGAPIPLLGIGFLDCRVEREIEFGSHSLFVGEVVDAGVGYEGDDVPEVLRMEDTRMSYGG